MTLSENGRRKWTPWSRSNSWLPFAIRFASQLQARDDLAKEAKEQAFKLGEADSDASHTLPRAGDRSLRHLLDSLLHQPWNLMM